jgi:hypothetical protein
MKSAGLSECCNLLVFVKEKNAKEDAKEVKAPNCGGVKRVAVKTRAVASDPPEEKNFSDQKSLEEVEAPEVAKSDHDKEVDTTQFFTYLDVLSVKCFKQIEQQVWQVFVLTNEKVAFFFK